jgi:pyruvate/2-oxoglutarate dehydrogenase complex dihydrolipoamide acyltransferase (E2) component
MPIAVEMPAFSTDMEVGEVRWLKHTGDSVSAGDVIAEVDADKVTFELEAPAAGTLAEVVHADGAEVPVGAVLAYIEETEGA